MAGRTKALRSRLPEPKPSDTPSSRRGRAVLDVTVVVLDGGFTSTAIGPIEVFYSAGVMWNWLRGEPQQPRFRVRVASIDGRAVTGPCSLGITPSCAIDDIDRTDIIIVQAPGWEIRDDIVRNTGLIPWLRKWHKRGAYIAGICTGVAFLAEAGLLDGRKATTHWAVVDIFRDEYPAVRWEPEHFVTEDSKVLCSGGIYAAIDISLYLVEKFCGHEIALQCAKSLLVSMPRSRQSGYAVVPLSRPHDDDKIKQAEEALREHLGREISIEQLAQRLGMSPRNFIRRFKAATGRMPGAYVQMLRIAAAKEMLEGSDRPIQAICTAVGYEDAAFFRQVFKRHTGMTPADYRERFAGMTFDRGENPTGVASPPGGGRIGDAPLLS